jgi:diacylglycerol kinase (ATP)
MQRVRLRRYAASFHHAFEGVMDAYRSQRHMRVHFAFIVLNGVLAMVYKLNAIEVSLVTICVALVVFAEMINTVIEAVLNIVCETYHPITRFAKDVAAGAVLIAALNAVVVATCIYGQPERIGRLRQVWIVGQYQDQSAMLRALAITVVLLGVAITAAKVGKPQGSVLEGGPISGHVAFAFCLATSVFFLIRDTTYAVIATALAGVVALLVAQLRLHDRAHRVRTVVYGAALGILIPLVVFGLLARPS